MDGDRVEVVAGVPRAELDHAFAHIEHDKVAVGVGRHGVHGLSRITDDHGIRDPGSPVRVYDGAGDPSGIARYALLIT